jgi:hypothetical protein
MRRPIPFALALPLNFVIMLAATIALTALSAPRTDNERIALAAAMSTSDVFAELATH